MHDLPILCGYTQSNAERVTLEAFQNISSQRHIFGDLRWEVMFPESIVDESRCVLQHAVAVVEIVSELTLSERTQMNAEFDTQISPHRLNHRMP